MLLYFLLLLRVISWFESQKCMIKPYHKLIYWKRSNSNCNGKRRYKVALSTTCVKIRTCCRYVGYSYYSKNLNLAACGPRARVGHSWCRVTRFKDTWNAGISPSLLSKTPFWSSMDLSACDFLPRLHRMVLTEHLVDLPVIGIQFMSAILPRLNFGLFHREYCGLSHISSAYSECRGFGFVLKPCLVGYISRVASFAYWCHHQGVTFLGTVATQSFPSAYPSSRWSCSRHSTSASVTERTTGKCLKNVLARKQQ